MNAFKVISLIALCVSLAYAGLANALVGPQCGGDMARTGMTSSAHADAAMHNAHRHAGVDGKAGSRAADGSRACRCPLKCACVYLCALGANASLSTISLNPTRIDTLVERVHEGYGAFMPIPLLTDVFRPPRATRL